MRYLVKAKVKPGKKAALLQAIEDGTLGEGSIAEREYIRDMNRARLSSDQTVHWVEVCYCPTPLEEEIPYWQEYFELLQIKNAHNPQRCRDLNGEEAWACSNCDCTKKLEEKMATWGKLFLEDLRETSKTL